MKQSKLEYLLSHLTELQYNSFQQALSNSIRKREQLLGKLLTLIHTGEHNPQALYANLYPEKSFSEKQLRNLRSELLNRLTDFLVHFQLDQSPDKAFYLACSLNHLQAVRYFPAMLKKTMPPVQDLKLSLDNADLNNRLQREFHHYYAALKGRKRIPLDGLIQSTEAAFVARTLYQAIAWHESQLLYQEAFSQPPSQLMEEILRQLEAGAWSSEVLVQLYYALYQLTRSPESIHLYQHSRSLLTQHVATLEISEARDMYKPLLNYCMRQWNQGLLNIVPEIFGLYEEMITHKLLIEESGISPWHFKAIVRSAAFLGKFDWGRTFIQNHQQHLPEQFKSTLLYYCQGSLYFFEGKLEQAANRMNQLLDEHQDPFLGLDARAFLLQIYYEQGNITGTEALINSYWMFLSRHKHLSANRLENHKSFIRFFRRLVNLSPNKAGAAEKLLQDILEAPYHASREWFLKMLGPEVQNKNMGTPTGSPHTKQAN